MLFVALWLWLDKPWLWALFEALALTYGPPAKDEPLEPSEQPLPPLLGERGRRQKKPKEKGAEDTDRAQGEAAAAEAPARAVGSEDSSHVSGRAPSVFEAGSQPDPVPESGPSAGFAIPPRRQTSRQPIVGPEARGRIVVEAREWLGHGK